MSPNSQAYNDAWKRARDAAQKELFGDAEPALDNLLLPKKADYLLDDLAAAVVRAVFGIEDDSK